MVVVHAEELLFVYVPPLLIVKNPLALMVMADDAVRLPPLTMVSEPTEAAEEFVTVPPIITLSHVPGVPAGLHVALLHVAPDTHVLALKFETITEPQLLVRLPAGAQLAPALHEITQ